MVQALNSGMKYASMAVVLVFVLGISINSMFSQGSSELDQMKRMILENEQAMAQKTNISTEEKAEEKEQINVQNAADESKSANDSRHSDSGAGVELKDFKHFESGELAQIAKYLPKVNIDGYLSRVFQVVYKNRASEYKDRFYRSFNSGKGVDASVSKASSEHSTSVAKEPEAPVKKSAGHLKAESYVNYVNEFGEQVYLDLDKYGKYRLTKMLIIGDSIASMSYHTMIVYMPDAIIDGAHSRQFDGAYEAYQKHLKESGGDIGDFVVLSLGTNGAVKSEDIDKVRKELNGRKLILISIVLPYKAEEDARNAEIYAYAKKYDDVYLVDWHAVAKNQKKWFFEDNIHPGENGAKVYSQLIMKKVIEIIEGQ